MSPSPFHLPTLPLSVCEDKDKWDSFGKLEFRAVSALSTLDGMMQASDKADLFWLTWLLKEAQSSNVIEGTVTTFDEILGENVGIVAPIERQDDVREVINYRNAMQIGIEEIDNGRPLTLSFVKAHEVEHRGYFNQRKAKESEANKKYMDILERGYSKAAILCSDLQIIDPIQQNNHECPSEDE